jgi:phospholipase C
MMELTDPERNERLEAEQPEAYLRRREFIARTASFAGLAGLATTLPSSTLVAEAARLQTRAMPLPSPRNMPLDTIVVLMMENRSFDHYFGWHPDADAMNEGLSYVDGRGRVVRTHRLAPDFQGCGHPDPDHSWDGGRFQMNGGRMDGFAKGNKAGTGSDEFACGYYLKQDVPFIPHAAQAYTLYDHYHCSIMGSTYPNREYMWAAQSGGEKSNRLPIQELGFPYETIFDRARARGVSVRYYNSDLPVSALWGTRNVEITRPVLQFYADAAAGNLPSICFVDPPFRDGGGADGASADEHPLGDIRLGQAFMSDVVHAFMESPQYERGALFVNYDEWGGFFDHVVPPRVPDDRASRDEKEDFGLTGFRVPTVAISPFTRGGRVAHLMSTHESILKLISYRFGLGYLNRRHRYATNIGRSFDWEHPDPVPATLPDPSGILATPCSLGGSQGGVFPRAKEHDLAQLETTGYLERLGYKAQRGTPENIFRLPNGARQALRQGNAAGR